ncbi:methyltransferase family protein [Vibrio sp. FJH11]
MQKLDVTPNINRIMDLTEQVTLIGLYAWLCFRLFPEELTSQYIYPLLILLSEGLVLVLVICRRKTQNISVKLSDWLVAYAGSFTVLLVDKGGEPFLPGIGVVLLLIGLMLHVGAKLSLRRSFGIVPADRGIKSDGLYRYIRHPMYFGYFITHIGFLLAVPSLWNFMLYCLTWALLITRIIFEERLLSKNSEYIAYQKKVHYRLIPKLF